MNLTISIPLIDRYGNVLAMAEIDEVDVSLTRHRWHVSHSRRYAFRRINGYTELMHRAIMNPASGLQVDHIDGNGLNNTRSNLRLATHAQNCMNKIWNKMNKSGFKGVCLIAGGRWGAFICHKRKRINLGSFPSPIEASAAYLAASTVLFKEFCHGSRG